VTVNSRKRDQGPQRVRMKSRECRAKKEREREKKQAVEVGVDLLV